MIEAAQARGADWTLHYGGRSRASMAYLDHLEQYGERVHLVLKTRSGCSISHHPRHAGQRHAGLFLRPRATVSSRGRGLFDVAQRFAAPGKIRRQTPRKRR